MFGAFLTLHSLSLAVANAADCDQLRQFRQITMAEFESALAGHAGYLADRNPSAPADLSSVDLASLLVDQPDRLKGVELRGIYLKGARLDSLDLSEANLGGADLTCAQLHNTKFIGARLTAAQLVKADLLISDLTGATLGRADLTGARLTRTNLEGANLFDATLHRARVFRAKLKDASFFGANLSEATWEPVDTPDAGQVGNLRGLETLQVEISADAIDLAGLNQLRAVLEQAGHRSLERDVVYARERLKTRYHYLRFERSPSTFWYLGPLSSARYILFDLTTAYGRAPFRALIILAGLTIAFAAYYTLVLRNPSSHRRSGIFRVLNTDRIVERRTWPRRHIVAGESRVEKLEPNGVGAAWRAGLRFSLLMTFRVGFRDMNVGEWLMRLQQEDATYDATGHLRSVAGVQSLVSLYLFAIWMVTYFGRPFG